MHKTDELRTARIDSLVTPQQLAEKLPISEAVADNVTASRKRIEKYSPVKIRACWLSSALVRFTIWMQQSIMQSD